MSIQNILSLLLKFVLDKGYTSQVLIELCREVKFSREDTKAKAAEKFSLEPAEAEKYMEKFW